MPLKWQARYFDGNSASATPAEVALLPNGIEISRADNTEYWPYKEVTQTMGFYAREPIRLERNNEAVVVTGSSIAGHLRKSRVRNARGPLRGLRLVVLLPVLFGLSLGLLSLIYVKGIPAGAGFIAGIVPQSLEERLGQSAEAGFIANAKEYKDPETVISVKRIVQRLGTAQNSAPYDFKVKIIDARVNNAFALPGGRILLYRGLIAQTRNAGELAGVVAHEMAHVIKRHATKGMLEQLSIFMLFSFIAGDASPVAAIASNLGNIRYTREAEAEADRLAARLLIEAGIDPAGLADFFNKARKGGSKRPGGLKYLSTHPDTKSRVAAIEALAAEAEATGYPALLPDVDWKGLAARALKGNLEKQQQPE